MLIIPPLQLTGQAIPAPQSAKLRWTVPDGGDATTIASERSLFSGTITISVPDWR
jgi:hypothetical protein